ncbi:MAG TPA: Zn-dependent hydrolase [Bryobacteraceae bacterium]|nr:Zn-dependent hydrolase [Bryobacteraceae bacterium]
MDANEIIRRCRVLAEISEEPGVTTRTFLSPPMREVHKLVREWMEAAGMSADLDAAGNLRGVSGSGLRPIMIGSHLDTVPRGGAFDGILGVIVGIALVEARPNVPIEVAAFSDEEGVRFGIPFIGSRAVAGKPVMDAPVLDAIREYGLDPAELNYACAADCIRGYLEFHIEQGPVLDDLGLPLGLVESIVGITRMQVIFHGRANHAGTTPMNSRRDALAGAAEWIAAVECEARQGAGLVATVGQLQVEPNASNAIAGMARASLDVRHADDRVRRLCVNAATNAGKRIAARRGLDVEFVRLLEQPATAMDDAMVAALERAAAAAGYPVHRMPSGAGHDAMVMAGRTPAAMLFLRSPGGISHHPDETVLPEDVAAALEVGVRFLDEWEKLDG